MKKLATYDTIKKIVKYMKSNFIRTSDPIFRQPSTAYAVGDIVYVKGVGVKYYLLCVTAGTTAETDIDMTGVADGSSIADGAVVWKVRKIGSEDVMPIGGILPFAGNDAVPAGYLLCDGAAVSRTMYPDLFSVIGTTYGAGDGSTTFNVPDYNTAKRFAQGDTVAGTVKQAGLPNITGDLTIRVPNTAVGVGDASPTGVFEKGAPLGVGQVFNSGVNNFPWYKVNLDASRSSAIYGASDTVQPYALTTRYIIKAFDDQTPDSALIDITQYANELAGKANRQLSNLDTANLACHVVVDSYYDSKTGDWWREYDDGWVEQGGHLPDPTGHSNTWGVETQVTLLKPMADSNYTVILGDYEPDDSHTAYGYILPSKSTTGFTFKAFNEEMVSGNFYPFDYLIFGMGAQ